jgi:uncharacterized protein (DUF1697 family)
VTAPAGTTRVALLRGINVGRAKRVAMSDLRAAVESLGYGDVRTLLNSGNVVFTVPRGAKGDPAGRIERAVADRCGVASRVTVLSSTDVARIVAENPLVGVANDPSRLLVSILRDPADGKLLAPLAKQDWGPEALACRGRAAYVWCPAGVADSRAMAAINQLLGDRVTARNIATLGKLDAVMSCKSQRQ